MRRGQSLGHSKDLVFQVCLPLCDTQNLKSEGVSVCLCVRVSLGRVLSLVFSPDPKLGM